MKDEPNPARPTPAGDASPGGVTAGERAVPATIAGVLEPDRSMAGRLHTLVRAIAPDAAPRLWYRMPAHDKDDMWPTAFALNEPTAAEARTGAPVRRTLGRG